MADNNINLIRDRAERPRTTLEKLSMGLPVVIFFAYALTLGLAIILVQSLNRQAVLVERRLERLREDPQLEQTADYDSEVLEEIEAIKEMVAQHEKRWEWNQILTVLQRHIPEKVHLTSFSGDSGDRLRLMGQASDAEGSAMDRVRNLVVGLESDPDFMRWFKNVIWQSSQTVPGDREGEEMLEFSILCQREQ